MTTTMRVTHKASMPTSPDVLLVTLQQENGPSIGQPVISMLVSSKRTEEFPLGGTVLFTHEEADGVRGYGESGRANLQKAAQTPFSNPPAQEPEGTAPSLSRYYTGEPLQFKNEKAVVEPSGEAPRPGLEPEQVTPTKTPKPGKGKK